MAHAMCEPWEFATPTAREITMMDARLALNALLASGDLLELLVEEGRLEQAANIGVRYGNAPYTFYVRPTDVLYRAVPPEETP